MGCLLYEYCYIPHTGLSATGVFQGPVYPTGGLRTLNIINVDGGDGVRVIGKIQWHILSIMISYKTLSMLAKLSSLRDWQLQ